MSSGDLATATIRRYQGVILPETGHQRVIVGVLEDALVQDPEIADHIAHNYETHGTIGNRDLCGPSCRGERSIY